MKKTLSFAVIWTGLATLGSVAIWIDVSWADQAPRVRLVLSTLPILGLFFIGWSWLRYQSVRVVEDETGKHYIWTELNGEERRSTADPRAGWDEDDLLADP